MRRLLVTGANGMVGRALLRNAGASAWHVLRPSRSELDLLDRVAVFNYFAERRPDAIVHAAGRVGGIQANLRAPTDFLSQNLDLGQNVMLAARASAVPLVINLGSSCMYPRGREEAMLEEEILTGTLEPTNEGYAIAKIATQRLCEYMARENPLCAYRTLVPPNLYGPHDSFDPARSHLIPAILRKVQDAVASKSAEIEIWGDGTARREFMYVDDLADAVFWALEMGTDLPDILNVGIGRDYSVTEYYSAAAALTGWAGQFRYDPSKPVGMKRKLIDSSRAAALGWRPKVDLADGMARTYQWYLENQK